MMKKLLGAALALILTTLSSFAASTSFQGTLGSGAGFAAWCIGGTGASCTGGAFWPSTIPANSSGTELFTSTNPGQVTGANGTFPATQSGTWTVQPGNTANTTPWLFNMGQMGGTNIGSGCVAALNTFGATIPSTVCPTMGAYVINTLAAISNGDGVTTATWPSGSPVAGLFYAFNGTSYDRLEDDANKNLKTTGPINVTPTDCSGSITTGGTAQNALAATATVHGLTIMNIDTSEPMWISFTATAAASTAGSYPLQAATATTFASPGSFTTPNGFGTNHALSVVAATTGHKWSCTWW